MAILLKHPEAKVEVAEVSNGKNAIQVSSLKGSNTIYEWETYYPIELIEKILNVYGPAYLCNEIQRDEDPKYVQICLKNDLLGYVSKEEFEGKKILDFGCGGGASTMVLARLFPKVSIVGIDIEPRQLEIARLLAGHYQHNNIEFICLPKEDELPCHLGEFDFIILSAVFEHMLPQERKKLMPQLWSILNPEGVIFIDQTPNRYFPFEGHTTRLPFINYLPDKLASMYVCKFCKRLRSEDWKSLLRNGIRGSSVREILGILRKNRQDYKPVLLKPCRLGFRDRIDLWYHGYAVSIANKYPKVQNIQKILRYCSKIFYYLTGIVLLPTLSLAIRKTKI